MGTEVSSSRFNKQDFRAYAERLAKETTVLEEWLQGGVFTEEHPKGALNSRPGWSIGTVFPPP